MSTWEDRDSAAIARQAAGLSRRQMLGLIAAGAGFGFGQARAEPIIRTVLTDIAPGALGTAATLFHEHLSFEWARVRGPNGRGPTSGPEKDVALVADQINIAGTEGVGCIVDAGTTD